MGNLKEFHHKMEVVLGSANELCRSAYHIALRKGERTDWEAFIRRLGESLLTQNDFIQPNDNANRYWVDGGAVMARISETDLSILRAELERLQKEEKRLRWACSKTEDEVQQILGKALGYFWFKDDQKNFPGATVANGVCVGEHVAATLAMEAVSEIQRLRQELATAEQKLRSLPNPG